MNVGIFHYDLDGVASAILLSKGFKFDKVYKGGYGKFDKFIEWMPKGSNAVVADCSFSINQYTALKAKAKQVVFIDHHPDSALIKETFTNDNVVFSSEKAAAGLCLDFIQRRKGLDKYIQVLAHAANGYDLFDRAGKWFDLGYDLDKLFWELHFDKFFKRFKDGFKGFTKDEKAFIASAKIKRDIWIGESVYVPFGTKVKGTAVIPADNSIMNDIPYDPRHEDNEVYYIIMRWPKSTSISVRSRITDLTEYMPYAEMHPEVQSAGGHPQASGVTFHSSTPSDETIIEVIQDLHQHIDAGEKHKPYDPDDIPF